MHPLAMFMMDLIAARNVSNAMMMMDGHQQDSAAAVSNSVVYFDSMNVVPEEVGIIGSMDDASRSSSTSGFINTTLPTDQQQQREEGGLAQLSGLAVFIMNAAAADGESTLSAAGISPTDASLTATMNWMSFVVAVALSVIVLLTIGGNLLILAAVLFNSNLRGPTHILIANLAVADLLLGFLVLPFSATLEVTGNWYFGSIFCDVWAAVDVLCCTASIMSLCVISVDRYIGVTRPLNYYSIVTAKRSTVLCLIVWISSLSISIGPLLGWKERSDFSTSGNESSSYAATSMSPSAAVSTTSPAAAVDSAELQACNVNKEKAYVLFSTIGSFYLPTLIILAIYWRIYRTAVKQTKFLESGTKTDKSTSSLSGTEVLTLRVHVGRANPVTKTVATTAVGHHHHHHRPSPPPPSSNNHLHVGKGRSSSARPSAFDSSANASISDRSSPSSSAPSSRMIKNNKNCVLRSPPHQPDTLPPPLNSELAKDLDELATVGPVIKKKSLVHHFQRKNSSSRRTSNTTTSSLTSATSAGPTLTVTTAASFSGGSSTGLSAKMFKFRRQKKAAKTLGIVVGAFLLCWFPFFVILPVEALCSTCNIPSPLFSCCFWLGYCNSCLNPFIYASTSREFKRAFSKILCGRRGRSQQSSAGRNFNYPQTVPPSSHFHRHNNVSNNSRNPSVENVSPTANQQLMTGGIKTKAQVSAATAVGAVDQCASIVPDH